MALYALPNLIDRQRKWIWCMGHSCYQLYIIIQQSRFDSRPRFKSQVWSFSLFFFGLLPFPLIVIFIQLIINAFQQMEEGSPKMQDVGHVGFGIEDGQNKINLLWVDIFSESSQIRR
jgi:hypothetical protein